MIRYIMLFVFILVIPYVSKKENFMSLIGDDLDDNIILLDNFEKPNPDWEYGYGTWKIRTDESNKILSHISTETFGVALLKTKVYEDIYVKVRFRPIKGSEDQSGGIIFRATDKDNYYLVRANALENNFRFYKIVEGKRQQLKSVEVTMPAKNQWHNLRVIVRGDQVQAFLDDKQLLEAKDTTFTSGFIGLWTKADSETDFDDFSIKLKSHVKSK